MIEDYGRRLLPSILQCEASNNPQRTFAIVARSDNVEDGYESVTYRQVADAANYVTKWLLQRFEGGKPTTNHPTIAFIGPNDLRYNILFYGALQCRYKVFLPSPRNPVSTTSSLLEQTECTKLVYTTELAPVVKSLQKANSTVKIQCELLPSLPELLAVPSIEFHYDLKYDDVYNEPVLILHSSGSTGRPKPVISTHGSFAAVDVRDFPTVPGRHNHEVTTTFRFSEPESYMYDVFPIFHLAGFFAKVTVPLMVGTIPVFDPPGRPPSGALVAKAVRLCNPRGLLLPPVIIEQLFQEPDREDLFRNRDIVIYAGGPLSNHTGSHIASWTPLCQFYGSTEVGQTRQLHPLRGSDDWAYIEFHPQEAFEFQPVEEGNGLHELVVFTGKHLQRTSALYHNYPDLTEYRTKDLFERHPTKPSLWKFHARLDDILVLSSGEKLNPIPLETYLSAVPGVRGALVVGTRYPQPALLLELSDEHTFANPLLELWPSIEAANSLLPGHGRITRFMVITATGDKPFKRAPKGTIVRGQTEELYMDEIRRLYDWAPKNVNDGLVPFKPSAFRKEDVVSLLRSVVNHVAIDSSLEGNMSLFEHGLDSVKTAEVVSLLKANLLPYKSDATLRWLSLETIYLNPTIDKLSKILLAFMNEDKIPIKLDTIDEIAAKVAEYTSNLPEKKSVAQTSVKNGTKQSSIAITGTTGFFGQYLLSGLVFCPEISVIYCLNRSPTAQEKFQKLGLQHETKLVFLQIDITAPHLGLRDDDYILLSETCSMIIHNAWQVDFNLPLGSFDLHLEGIRHIIAFCAGSSLRARFMFVSSIAATGVWSPPGRSRHTVPEVITSVEYVEEGLQIGYAKSKCVAEHILDRSAAELAIPVTILRLGHILPAASEPGSWPPNDSLALYLQTGKMSQRLARDFLDTVNWLPVDSAADIVSEIVQDTLLDCGKQQAGTQVFNIVNPHERPWESIMETVTPWCGTQVAIVPMKEWVEQLLQSHGADADALSRFPALRISLFYDLWTKRGRFHQYAVDKSMAVSKTMRALQAPNDELIKEWLCLL